MEENFQKNDGVNVAHISLARFRAYTGTSLFKKCIRLESYRRPMPRVSGGS